MSVDFRIKDWHYASWLHICQSKKLGKMQFFNPHENGSCSHSFESSQSTYVLNQDFEVYPKKAAIFTSGMYFYLLKAKALKIIKKAKKHSLNMVKRYLNWAVNQQLHLHTQASAPFDCYRLLISKCKRKKCTKIPECLFLSLLWFQPFSAPTAGGRQKDEFYLLRWDVFENEWRFNHSPDLQAEPRFSAHQYSALYRHWKDVSSSPSPTHPECFVKHLSHTVCEEMKYKL